MESVFFGVGDSDRKFRRKSSKKLVHGSEILSHVFVADHLVILGGADGKIKNLTPSLSKFEYVPQLF